MLDDYRTVIGPEFRTVVADFGPQAGVLAHLVRSGAEASLCGIPRSSLGDYEDLDEPVCASCIAWHARMLTVGKSTSQQPVRPTRPSVM